MTAPRKVTVEEENSSDKSENELLSSDEDKLENNEVDEEGDGSESSDSEINYDIIEDSSKTNAGWADSIAKILKINKPKGKKTLVLSRAKKLTDLPKKKSEVLDFEIENKEGQVKREIESESSDDDDDDADKVKHTVRKKKKELPSVRIKPNILHRDRERNLCKVATKGVVQLFNAVRTQQKEINVKLKEAGSLEVRREKVLKSIDKRAFLDVLMGKKSEVVKDGLQQNEGKSGSLSQKINWDVLKDDFMMGSRMKDWDKEKEEKENEIEMEIESD